MLKVILLIFTSLCSHYLHSQKYGYSVKTGSGLASQRGIGGGSSGRSFIGAHHLDFGLDYESEGGNIIYGQLGYHRRGSGVRINQFFDIHGNVLAGGTFGMKFHNMVLEAGMKKFFLKGKQKAYYGLGLRCEYTLKSDHDFFYAQYKDFVQKWNYGFGVRVGTETQLSKFIALGIEANIAPDISRQVWVQQNVRIIDPRTNMITNGQEQNIRNLSLELTIYLRLLQIIEYID